MAAYPDWQKQFELALIPHYGLAGAHKAASVLLPAILGDFRKMLLAAPPHTPVHETYHTDDGKTDIVLTGERLTTEADPLLILRTVSVGGRTLDLQYKVRGISGVRI